MKLSRLHGVMSYTDPIEVLFLDGASPKIDAANSIKNLASYRLQRYHHPKDYGIRFNARSKPS